ncbi:MAG: hypothetical protein JOZ75_10560 [Candidatus Dormibacteraeota bacterium]|nr:hypothetical protein [Candidatus Dormibacteraeota bacterium]
MRAFTRPLAMFATHQPLTTRGLVNAGAIVVLSGCAAAGIGVGTSVLDGSGLSGVVSSLLVPLLFLAYWGVQAWLIDAGAGMLGRAGSRRAMLVASAPAFRTWIVYALVTLVEAAAARSEGAGSPLAIALTVLTLPVLLWFLALTVRAVRDVYDVPAINAFALALLPYAAVALALVIVSAAGGLFRG